MDIKEEIAIKIRQKLCGSTVPGAYTPHQRDIADFILKKSTLELLRPLYGVEEGKMFELLRRQDWFRRNRRASHDDMLDTAKALSEGDVVGVL